jgi:hypothetical protein
MAETLELEIVTPERLVVHESVEEVQIPGRSGYLGVLPDHAPLITELGVGEITFRSGGVTTRLAVAWGFAEVLANKVTILAETSERMWRGHGRPKSGRKKSCVTMLPTPTTTRLRTPSSAPKPASRWPRRTDTRIAT